MSSNGHVQLSDYSDREILAMMLDLSEQGDITVRDLAIRVYGWTQIERDTEQDKVGHGIRCCTSRMAWMRRFGLVEKGEEKGQWLISKMGRSLVSSRMQENVTLAIRNTPDHRVLDLAHLVGVRMVEASDPYAGIAMRRELQHQIQRRKRV